MKTSCTCLLTIVLIAAAGGSAPTTAAESMFSPKLSPKLDPFTYRSSSQGELMPKELNPPTKADYDEIDSVIDRAVRTHGYGPIIPQYYSHQKQPWQQWEGTIIERLWRTALYHMLVPTVLLCVARWADPSLPWWRLPKEHTFGQPFFAVSDGYNYLLTLTTFVTTFFVGHSHDFWRRSYKLTRSLQGRLNDIGLLCASHARRSDDGGLDAEALELLESTARNLRLLHVLFYADICYRKTVRAGSQTAIASARPPAVPRAARPAPLPSERSRAGVAR